MVGRDHERNFDEACKSIKGLGSWFGVWGLGFRVWGLWIRVWDLGSRV